MNKSKLKLAALVSALALPLMAGSCDSDAAVASRNLSTAADNFEIMRNVVFYNVWTDTEVASLTGLCSISVGKNRLTATCKEPGGYKKHYLGRSANLSFFAIQLDSVNVSSYHTRIIWKPQSFIPDIDVKGSLEELTTNQNTDG